MGVIGVVAAALDLSSRTYTFISRIKHAPKEIEDLAGHLKAIYGFLDSMKTNLEQTCVMQRPQNQNYLQSVEDHIRNLTVFLGELNRTTRRYDAEPVWTNRVRWAMKKPEIQQLESLLMSRYQGLSTVLMCMNLFI